MKRLQTLCIFVLFTFCYFTSNAQNIPINEPNYNKPRLFQDLPDRLPINVVLLQQMLGSSVGKLADIEITNNLILKGQVVSSATKFNNQLQSVVIRLTNRNGASLNFSKIKNADGTEQYTGRIISFQHGDGYELVSEKGQYYLIKKQFYDMINE